MLAERLKFETEVLKLLVLLGVAIGGGSLGLLLGESSYMKIILARDRRTGDRVHNRSDLVAIRQDSFDYRLERRSGRMSLMEWISVGIWTTILASFAVLAWKVVTYR